MFWQNHTLQPSNIHRTYRKFKVCSHRNKTHIFIIVLSRDIMYTESIKEAGTLHLPLSI